MATYTTAQKVRDSAAKIQTSGGGLTDAMIDVYIEEAEQILNASMRYSFLSGGPGTFDRTKHGILEAAANLWATMRALEYDTSLFVSLADANSAVMTFMFQFSDQLAIIKDRETIKYLVSI